jgi:hypothetical protein
VIKVATLQDVTAIARNMRAHDRAERLALSHGSDPVAAAVAFLDMNHMAVTVWRGEAPVAVIGVVFAHPGVASTIFFATDEFPKVAIATTRFVRRTLFPILVETGIHRLQVCSMLHTYDDDEHDWILSFGAKREAVLVCYGKDLEDFALFTMSDTDMARVTSGGN